jgi:hypothetical protein
MYEVNNRYQNIEIENAYAYWQSKVRDCGFPNRSDIDPLDMRQWISAVLLAEAKFDADGTVIDFYFRVAGTRVGDRYGRDLTRRHLSEVSLDHQNANILANYRAPIETRRPIYSISRFTDHEGLLRSFETLLMPLSSDGRACDMILGVVMPLPQDFEAPEGVWFYDADNVT